MRDTYYPPTGHGPSSTHTATSSSTSTYGDMKPMTTTAPVITNAQPSQDSAMKLEVDTIRPRGGCVPLGGCLGACLGRFVVALFCGGCGLCDGCCSGESAEPNQVQQS
ncbi:hypothetical protein M407DRAFT_96034 [Tulasnella calospora MUT 4182]|uniref:Uncharacterized protein n=1 Tax=Tulasnella calospora MUT 4182 TaxID=1051891 RepID=A0A0C3QVS1_9AGAM|nr:hypothetical protein M407DRAFT_96034 [Tulasnella calospora MUT 4182]